MGKYYGPLDITKISIILFMLIFAGLGVLLTVNEPDFWTEIFMYSFVIPILISSFFYGRVGGLSVALVSVAICGSLVFCQPEFFETEIMQRTLFLIVLFSAVALVTAELSGREREAQSRYRHLFEGSPMGLYRISPNGEFMDANIALAEMLGYPDLCSLLEGTRMADLYMDPGDYEQWIGLMKSEGAVRDFEARVGCTDGTTIWVRDTARAVCGMDGSLLYYEGGLWDITGSRMAKEGLELARKKLSILNRITFNNIQNSIFSLVGYIELQKEMVGDEPMKSYLDTEKELAADIASSLEFARYYQDMGMKPPVWKNVLETYLYAVSHLDLGDITKKEGVEGLEIYADPLLEKVFFNLAENVIRHGKNATEISLDYNINEEGLTLVFADNGAGIPLEMKEEIFRRPHAKEKGKGLFLAREILSITWITIEETGIPGRGARFEMRVPKEGFRFSYAEESGD